MLSCDLNKNIKMKISYNWLKQFIKIDWKSDETAALLTDFGPEVGSGGKIPVGKRRAEGIVVGHVLTCVQHPDADRLKVTTLTCGDGAPVQIVVARAMLLLDKKCLSYDGTTLYDKDGMAFVIKKGKIRDEEAME